MIIGWWRRRRESRLKSKTCPLTVNWVVVVIGSYNNIIDWRLSLSIIIMSSPHEPLLLSLSLSHRHLAPLSFYSILFCYNVFSMASSSSLHKKLGSLDQSIVFKKWPFSLKKRKQLWVLKLTQWTSIHGLQWALRRNCVASPNFQANPRLDT